MFEETSVEDLRAARDADGVLEVVGEVLRADEQGSVGSEQGTVGRG